MNSTELGKRIKEARLAKKLTQTEVAGDFITRNMLSQIESGTANPSLKTLEYLTSVLDIPIQALMPDGKGVENAGNPVLQQLCRCKELFNSEKYSDAIGLASKLTDTELEDEAYALIARSYINMAQREEKDENYSQAAEYANNAYTMADKGIYASRDIKTVSALLMNRVAEKLSE